MSNAGRKPRHQLQYMPGSDGHPADPGTVAGVWENCVSDTADGGTQIGPASKAKAIRGKRDMQRIYPRITYRVINLNQAPE